MCVFVCVCDILFPVVNQVCRIPLDMGGGVRSCDLADPFAIVLLVDGTVAILRLREGEEPTLEISWPDPVKVGCSCFFCLR